MKLLSKNEKKSKIKIWAPRILFVVYLAVVLRITVFRSDFSFQNFLSGGSINLKLLAGYAELVMGGHWWMFCYLFFGNIIWFVPLGMYLEMIGRTKRLWQAALIGFLFSMCIETLQYLFGTGYSELDDLLLNTLGVWVGAVEMRVIKRYKLHESLFTIADNSVMIEKGKRWKIKEENTMDKIERYIDELLANSTPDRPVWNIEKIMQGLKSTWNYIDGCMIKAILEMYAITKDEKYFTFADSFIDCKVQEDGSIDGYSVDELNIDNVNAGKTLFELYDLTGKEKYRKAIDLVYSQIEKMPRTKEGNFWHKNIYPNQVWLDGLYMCQPFYIEYETRFNNKKNYDDIFHQFFNVVEHMRDPKTGLYYHAYDSSREMFWCDKVTGLSQNFWLRALGWYSMALLDTLDKADASVGEPYERMKQIFVELMDAMLRYQDESGMWYQVVNVGGMDKNYLETSGSSIMSYALLKGVRLGFLPENYRAYGEKAFHGICEKYLTEDAEGGLHLDGICLVAGLGGNQKRPGTYDYYMSEPVVKDDAKGVGPFLLAYTEMRRAGLIQA